ncbi:MAG TPA: nickel-type superoxide dismutase maturation protease [Xenococcaceae cyanobacterium]
MEQLLKSATIGEIILWLLGKRRRLRIRGASMQPLLQPGEEILINPDAYQKSAPKIGDIIVALHPYRPKFFIVKRVISIEPDGSYFLQGDNTLESTDSRVYGAIKLDQILGQVTSRFA